MPFGQAGVSATATPQRPPKHAAGITFAIDTTPDAGPARGVFTPVAGVVVFAAGRGRLDIIVKSGGPAVAVNGISIGAPLAGPGDYYLFDSTGFVLVRPATRTFSSFSLVDASYNYRDDRDGWPAAFEFAPLHPDTLGSGGAGARPLIQRGRVPIYWHLDLQRQTPPIHVLARGRLTIQDTPAGEVGVVRWFGPAQALANIPGGAGALLSDSLRITAVAVLSPPGEDRTPLNLITLHAISGLKTVDVDLSRLVIPRDFTETPWPGFEGTPNLPALSPNRGAKWREVPALPRE